MSIIYRAGDTTLHRFVALDFLPAEMAIQSLIRRILCAPIPGQCFRF